MRFCTDTIIILGKIFCLIMRFVDALFTNLCWKPIFSDYEIYNLDSFRAIQYSNNMHVSVPNLLLTLWQIYDYSIKI